MRRAESKGTSRRTAFTLMFLCFVFGGCRPQGSSTDWSNWGSIGIPNPAAKPITVSDIDEFAKQGKGYAAAMERFGQEGFVPASIPALAYPDAAGGFFYLVFSPDEEGFETVLHYPDSVVVLPAEQRGRPFKPE